MRLGNIAVILLCGLVVIGDLFFIFGLAKDLMNGPGGI